MTSAYIGETDGAPKRSSRILKWLGISAAGVLALAVAAVLICAYTPGESANLHSAYLDTVDSRFIDTNLAKFHYIRAGNGPPVVLVHGGGEWAYSYRSTIQALARTHTVYAVDLPGHGYTQLEKKNFAWTVDGMAGSLGTFLDAMGLNKVDLVGHSWGGGWALRYAETHPDRVDRLVLIDSSGLVYDDIWVWKILNVPVIGELMVHRMGPSDARSFLQKSFHDQSKVTDAVANEYWAPSSQPLARTALLELQRNQDWSVTERDTAKVAAPTLVLWGSDDAFIPRSVGERLAALLPGNRFVALEGCGHSSLEECSGQGNQALIGFLGKYW
ncbi:alpha/beta fold hydrolase [Dyella flagellata]|uniref:AB hydrolase-1 domain-containing protein n=1 Tax=Dyella flagellata TaxID=1867833 RepID=A0ABQ5XH22_9GAMM|nr:alpha/beta fold hydrolase [Dyella flagellata]GLQ90257.1 hypothetical protein GCM10007898_38320 [Dyella flagellata]